MNEGAAQRRGRLGRAAQRRRRRTARATATARTSPPRCRSWRCAGATSGLLLSIPRQGLGNSAIASVADDEQLERYGGRWAAMAITEPEAGSDSAAIRTTAALDGDEYVLNGEKIYVTAGERADLVVVWATLDRAQGRAAIKSFVVERSNPGLMLERLEHKLGIRASDTAAFRLEDCRVPERRAARLAGDRRAGRSFAGAHADLRQHPAAGGRHGRRRHPRLPRAHARRARRGRRDRRPGPRPHCASPPPPPGSSTRGRLRGRPPADAAGRLDGRQRPPELAAGVDGQGQGRPHRRRRRPGAASSCAAPTATARTSCWRSGRATRRSSTSSRAPSRSSC